ncbi:MAG: extracellular solute-binding protein, partial [Cyanobacteria bacterium J06642_11]
NGHVDLGLVYATDAALVRTIEVFTTVPTNLHAPIVYPIATVQTSAHPEAAQEFITFLTTAAAQVIFEQFGFNPLPPLSGHLS